MSGKTYEVDGGNYTLSQLSKMTGVKLPTICKRLSRGRSIEEAISTERLVMNRVNYKYFVIVGGKKVSLHSEAKRRGVRYKTALDRHKAGKTFKEVFNPLPKYSLTYDNQTYSLRYWSRLRGIPYSTLKWRYNEGWKVGEILGFVPRERKCKRKSG